MLLDREAVLSIDIEAACIQRLQRRYPNHPNLQTAVCEVTSSELLALKSFDADSCVCLNVLEHIDEDHQAVERMASVLTPGGVIVLMVPALPVLYGPIDRNLGHYRRYTRASLSAVAREVGLRIRKMHYMNCVGLFGWWTNSHLFHREAQSEFQIRVFDRYVVPLLSRTEEWMRPPLGQSLFAVLQRP
jgi:SAM-dependent methyltransferase